MKVAVVGGGVVGLCCAYALERAGAEVTVVERGLCGGAASSGNAGWIVPSYSAPLSAPGVVKQSLKWILDSEGPLRVRPRLDPDLLRWSWRFWRSSTPKGFERGLKALLGLNESTMRLFDEMREAGVEFEMHTTGLVIAALTEAALEEEVEEHRKVEAAGYDGRAELLDGEAARRLEPALSDRVVGGMYLRSERHVRPESLVSGLLDHLKSRGVEILERTEVHDLSRGSAGSWRLDTSRGPLPFDSVVVAAGVWSGMLLKRLGVPVLIEGGKGVSLTSKGRGTRPGRALKLAEARVTCTPFAEGVRISGTLDLSGMDLALDRRRLQTVVRSAVPYLKDWEPGGFGVEWAGLRPLTPDSLPIIGPVPGADRLYVATGHGQLGLTLAPATGAALVPLVLEGRVVPEIEAFGLDRFGHTVRLGSTARP